MKNSLKPIDGVKGKIVRLVLERGWNQDKFARIAGISRLTVRNIFQFDSRGLHNSTLAKCARALDMTVYDLCELPLEQLVRQAHESAPPAQRVYEEATQPELLAWLQGNGERAQKLTEEERDELLSLQGTGGPLTAAGVESFVQLIERKRRMAEKMAVIAGTEHIDQLEQFINDLHEKIQPYRDRK